MRLVPTSRPTAPTSSTSETTSFIVGVLSPIDPPVYEIQEKKRILATNEHEYSRIGVREGQPNDSAQFPVRGGDILNHSAANWLSGNLVIRARHNCRVCRHIRVIRRLFRSEEDTS